MTTSYHGYTKNELPLVTKPLSERPVIIAARANDVVVSRLVDGAFRALASKDVSADNTTLIRVNGSLEIPLALAKAVHAGLFSSFVVLGAVIKGQTDHYDHVARMANDGVLELAFTHRLALGNGILTVHSFEQAMMRADGPHGNLGCDAALAALDLSVTFQALDKIASSR